MLRLLSALLALHCLAACQSKPADGEKLARQYCASCHLFPEPELLPRSQWANHVLPQMARFMGRYENDSVRLAWQESMHEAGESRSEQVFPNQAVIDDADWQAIVDWYLSMAPAEAPAPAYPESVACQQFEVVLPPNRFGIPSTTLVRIRPDGYWLSDANNKSWMELRKDFSVSKAGEIAEGGVDVQFWGPDIYSLFMGSFSPTEARSGMLLRMKNGKAETSDIAADSLQRPVCLRLNDWNGDQQPDFLICEFGRFTGSLSIWYSTPKGTWTREELSASPGALAAEVRDLNGDGREDILVLFAQADERIEAYLQQPDGSFESKTLLRFSPSNGSSSFQLADIDGDGQEDILYTAGDNADFPAVNKAAHGVYVFRQQALLVYKQTAFYPLPGAYAVRMFDADGDGDQDLACTAFFPDWGKLPDLGFVWMENTNSGMRYHYFPKLHTLGRWMVMDAGDADGDGDTDLMLGAFTMETSPSKGLAKQWATRGVPFVLLRNRGKR
jgi:hypothetical protein